MWVSAPLTASSSRPRCSNAVALRFNALTLIKQSKPSTKMECMWINGLLSMVQLQRRITISYAVLVLRWGEVGVALRKHDEYQCKREGGH